MLSTPRYVVMEVFSVMGECPPRDVSGRIAGSGGGAAADAVGRLGHNEQPTIRDRIVTAHADSVGPRLEPAQRVVEHLMAIEDSRLEGYGESAMRLRTSSEDAARRGRRIVRSRSGRDRTLQPRPFASQFIFQVP